MRHTRWPDGISLFEDLLVEAEEHGELLPHAVPAEIARLVVGAWTGVQLGTEARPESPGLSEVIARRLQDDGIYDGSRVLWSAHPDGTG
ncbi:hypothetical protein AB0N81_31525 [Streptomyces sp. NPDC093510]|uniref:hypothetical protein n=1 Tax=Streptomyces sp. NPDC093510 TaxID=3155199 RepID=UPI003416C4B7